MIQVVYSKQLFNGGRIFCKWNTETKWYVEGNTAGTAVSHSCDLDIYNLTVKEVRAVSKRLDQLGYKDHTAHHILGHDVYEALREEGL